MPAQAHTLTMKNRASSHLFVLLLIVGFEIAGYYGIYRAALLRGYETSVIGAVRDLLMYLPLVVLHSLVVAS